MYTILFARQSIKLHCLAGRESTAAVTSRTHRVFSFCEGSLYHFVSRVLPWRLISRTKLICAVGAEGGGAGERGDAGR